MKINIDASFDSNLMRGAIAVVARDELGDFLTGVTRNIVCSSPIAVVACALREAITLAGAFDSFDVVVESDCSTVVKSCSDSSIPTHGKSKLVWLISTNC